MTILNDNVLFFNTLKGSFSITDSNMQKKKIFSQFLTSNQFGLIKNRQESVWMEETHIYTLSSSIVLEDERSTTVH